MNAFVIREITGLAKAVSVAWNEILTVHENTSVLNGSWWIPLFCWI